MSPAPRELLVILEGDAPDAALAHLRSVADVTQVLAPRLALVRADEASTTRAEQIAGVLGVYDDTPPELPHDLTSSELLFISAWAQRAEAKVRPGEGLSWDAPGFEPPDPPAHPR